MMKKVFLLFTCILLVNLADAQVSKKNISASPVTSLIRIDGILDEQAWSNAAVAGDFIQREPFNGMPSRFKSEVRLLYDNGGLYVGARMYDPAPDSIPGQLGLRDAPDLNADYFVLVLSPFNDGINAFCFLVYVSDVQADFKLIGPEARDDFNWDAVWSSKARKVADGWIAEMKIPYAAIRFPSTPVQEWGINLQRQVRRCREISTWNLVDAKVSGYVNQSGVLQGIRDVTPPLRLSLMPYVSGYLENSPEEREYDFSYNVGADLKYGLNESFTLDMTLIPDFGQVRSDDKIYNFTPFEIQYAERRQFFTEGTELFSKGDIFYTRRVGSQPKGYDGADDQLDDNEIITENPTTTRLFNASKISGRTSDGLGVGLFNAISGNTWATVTDTVNGETRRILTQGFTNYNMIVLDQSLKNNSFLDFLNTNYFMPTEGYTANVTGTTFKFANKPFTYALSGEGFISQKYYSHQSPEFGYKYDLSFAKISGNFRFEILQELQTDTYDPNDMGFNLRNNLFENTVELQYNIYTPFWKLLNWYNRLSFSYNTLYTGFDYTSFEVSGASFATTRKHLSLGLNTFFQPVEGHDYYEPRVDGWMYVTPAYGNLNGWISTDYSKTFAIDFSLSGYLSPEFKSSAYEITMEPRYRISERFFLKFETEYSKILNDVGYVDDYTDASDNTTIVFGRRDRQTVNNVLEANYMITGNMSFDLRLRQYWVTADYLSYYTLQSNGRLIPGTYPDNPDVNYNNFNFDLIYVWNFAPGSQLSVMWKNAISTYSNEISPNFFDDLRTTLESPASNSFSIRILYYLDANYLKKKSR